eukprot:5541332-Amphidinium_carterae.1
MRLQSALHARLDCQNCLSEVGYIFLGGTTCQLCDDGAPNNRLPVGLGSLQVEVLEISGVLSTVGAAL